MRSIIPDSRPVRTGVLAADGESSRSVDDALELFGAAIDGLPVGVLLVGRDGIIARTNRESQRVFGYDRPDLIGRSVDMLVPDGSRAAHASLRQAFEANPRTFNPGVGRALFGRRKDGSEVAIEVGLTPMSLRGTAFVLASITDVSTRRSMPAAAQEALDERLEFERLVGELGAEFGNLRPADVDRGIEEALGRLVRALGIDRSALFQVEETGDFVHTHQWTRPGWAPPPPRISARERFPWLLARIRGGELVRFASLDEIPDETDRLNLLQLGTKSAVTVPLMTGGEVWGALSFGAVREPRTWTDAEINRFRVVALLFANALARKAADERLRTTLEEMSILKERLHQENSYLRHELSALSGTSSVVGNTPAIRRVLEQVRQVAPMDSTVLLIGETGTGKALLAAQVHELSGRNATAMMRVNCAHLSAAWLESELGWSHTGARANAEGRRGVHPPLANGGTVFLDEISDLPLEAQAALTRVLQDRQAHAPGTTSQGPLDVRFIAATRKDLKQCIADGSFRDDLFYKLNVFPVHVPPLRERREDIPLLVWRFVDEFAEAYGKPIDAIDQASMAALQAFSWPGNVRELRNVVERAMIVPTGRRLRISIPVNRAASVRRGGDTLAVVEKEHIITVLAEHAGSVRGRRQAAIRLGLSPRALELKLASHGLVSRNG